MPDMINFRVYIWPKSTLSVTSGKKCCIIKLMCSITEIISLKIKKIKKEGIERVTKCERAICRPECFKMILNSERVKTCLFLSFKFPFLRLVELSPYVIFSTD